MPRISNTISMRMTRTTLQLRYDEIANILFFIKRNNPSTYTGTLDAILKECFKQFITINKEKHQTWPKSEEDYKSILSQSTHPFNLSKG